MAFGAEDGEFLWQMAHDKLPAGRVNDWPQQGVCSTPFVEGDRLYYTSNRAIVSLDTEGFRDRENDGGPREGEGASHRRGRRLGVRHDGGAGRLPPQPGGQLPAGRGRRPLRDHRQRRRRGPHQHPLAAGPSFVALDKKTGKLVWESNLPGEKIFHGKWSNPTYGVIKGRPQVIFPGGDGWIYSFEPKTGKLLWKFDANPRGRSTSWAAAAPPTRSSARPVVYDDKVYIGVGQDPEHGEGVGQLLGDRRDPGRRRHRKGKVWHRGGDDFHRTISTVAIQDGIVYASDLSGFLYALDAKTGAALLEARRARRGLGLALRGRRQGLPRRRGRRRGGPASAGKTKEVLGAINMGGSVYTTPVAKDGVLYVLARNRLFALQQGVTGKPATPRAAGAESSGSE